MTELIVLVVPVDILADKTDPLIEASLAGGVAGVLVGGEIILDRIDSVSFSPHFHEGKETSVFLPSPFRGGAGEGVEPSTPPPNPLPETGRGGQSRQQEIHASS